MKKLFFVFSLSQLLNLNATGFFGNSAPELRKPLHSESESEVFETTEYQTIESETTELKAPSSIRFEKKKEFIRAINTLTEAVAVSNTTASPSKKIVTTSDPENEIVTIYKTHPITNILEPIQVLVCDGAPTSIAFSPTETSAIVANSGIKSRLSIYKINKKTNRWSLSQTIEAQHPTYVSYSPNGKFAAVTNYASGQKESNICIYRVHPKTKQLIFLAQFSPDFQVGSFSDLGKNALAFSPDERFLAVTNFDSNTISIYEINPINGILSQIIGSPYMTGSEPVKVAYHSNAPYIAVANGADNSISFFAADPMTGALTEFIKP